MSIAIPLKELRLENEQFVKQIHQQLTVTSIEKGSNSDSNLKWQQGTHTADRVRGQGQPKVVYKSKPKTQIEAYSLSENNQHIYMPFSYVYHHFPSWFQFNMSHISQPCLPSKIQFEGSLLDRQKEIRTSVFDILNRTHSVLLCLHTGFGKTIFTIYLMHKLRKHTLILCHRKIIIEQWKEAVLKYLPEVSVDIWTPKMSIDKQPDILIANASSITKWSVDRYKQYGLLVADEVHTMCTEQMSRGFSLICPQYVIGLSATPFREDGLDRLLELYIGPEMVVREMKKQFNVYKVNTGFTPRVEYTADGGTDWNSVLESQAQSPERNQLLVNLIRFFSTRVILVLVKRVDHAHTLCQLLKEKGENVDVFLGSSKKANYDSRVLIATYSKGGVGFDHPKLDLLCTAADVESNYAQYLGRVFRRDHISPIVLDLIDSLQTMNKHSKTRMRICKEAGGTIRNFSSCFTYFSEYCNLLK
jgi:superfamily II DNA or RNA helicase